MDEIIKDDMYYLEKLIKSINRIVKTMSNISYEEFENNEDIQDITMFNLIQISENSKRLSEEYKSKHQNIPWHDVYGLRNRIVHDYGSVVLDTVYYTLVEDIPKLLEMVTDDVSKTIE